MSYRYGICMEGNEDAFTDAVELALEPNFVYVEIGLANAGTTAGVLQFLNDRNQEHWKIFGIDIPEGWALNMDYCKNALKDVLHDVLTMPEGPIDTPDKTATIILKPGADVLRTQFPHEISFAFVDGCHGKACAMNDFLAVVEHSKVGTVVVFHDTTPWCQGIHLQPHCGTGIGVRKGIIELGLLNNMFPGWQLIEETNSQHGIVVVRRNR